MTDPRGRDDEVLLAQLARALSEDGELVPTSEIEVRQAEDAGAEEVALPAALAEPRSRRVEAPRGEQPRDLVAYRASKARGLVSHAAALVMGAAAAAAVLLAWPDEEGLDLRDDPAGVAPSAAPAPVVVTLAKGCDGCCAGVDCARADPELRSCPSGRSCVACARERLAASRYRLRLGAVHPAEGGREVLERYPRGEPELCVRVGASPEQCRPTLLSERERWNSLPLVGAAGDLSAQVSVRLRWKGVREPLATAGRWTSPVAVTPAALCKGYVVKLESGDGELFGTASLFLDETHHVELGRAGEVEPLRALRRRLALEGLEAFLHETQAAGDERFVLAFGPFDRDQAERLRWQLVEQHQPAVITSGDDYLGSPRALP